MSYRVIKYGDVVDICLENRAAFFMESKCHLLIKAIVYSRPVEGDYCELVFYFEKDSGHGFDLVDNTNKDTKPSDFLKEKAF